MEGRERWIPPWPGPDRQSPAERSPRERVLSFRVKRRSSHSEVRDQSLRSAVEGPFSCCLPPGGFTRMQSAWPSGHTATTSLQCPELRKDTASEVRSQWTSESVWPEKGAQQCEIRSKPQLKACSETLTERVALRDHGSGCYPDPQSGGEGRSPTGDTPFLSARVQCQAPASEFKVVPVKNTGLFLIFLSIHVIQGCIYLASRHITLNEDFFLESIKAEKEKRPCYAHGLCHGHEKAV